MGSIAKVKEIMEKCSMPLELTAAEFREQASDRTRSFGLTHVQTKDDIINAMVYSDYKAGFCLSLNIVKDLVKALLEHFDKPSEYIDDIEEFPDMMFLLRHGIVIISEEERKQKEQGNSQRLGELFGALNDITANSKKKLEEVRKNIVEEINPKRKQMLQEIEALRGRLAELDSACENILQKR